MDETAEKLEYLAQRAKKQQSRFYARQPKTVGKVLARLVMKNRYACVESGEGLAEVWRKIVDGLVAERTQAVGVNRGKFEVVVAHSTLVQELSFDKPRLLAALRQALPEVKIDDLKFKVGRINKK